MDELDSFEKKIFSKRNDKTLDRAAEINFYDVYKNPEKKFNCTFLQLFTTTL